MTYLEKFEVFSPSIIQQVEGVANLAKHEKKFLANHLKAGGKLDRNELNYILDWSRAEKNPLRCSYQANKEKILEKFLELGDIAYLYKFANFFQNISYTKRIQEKLLELGDAQYLYYFAKNVEGTDNKRISTKLVELGAYGAYEIL